MILVVLALVLVVLLALCAATVTLVRRERERTAAELSRTRAEAAELRAKVEALAMASRAPAPPEEFVITSLGEEPEGAVCEDAHDTSVGEARSSSPAERIGGRLFADIVLRESVVKAAALGHGVRRALAPEVRNRVRFEMKREVKRSRKARKDEYRRVRDEIRARERAALIADDQPRSSQRVSR